MRYTQSKDQVPPLLNKFWLEIHDSSKKGLMAGGNFPVWNECHIDVNYCNNSSHIFPIKSFI